MGDMENGNHIFSGFQLFLLFCTKLIAHMKQKSSVFCRTMTACQQFSRNPNVILGSDVGLGLQL